MVLIRIHSYCLNGGFSWVELYFDLLVRLLLTDDLLVMKKFLNPQ